METSRTPKHAAFVGNITLGAWLDIVNGTTLASATYGSPTASSSGSAASLAGNAQATTSSVSTTTIGTTIE